MIHTQSHTLITDTLNSTPSNTHSLGSNNWPDTVSRIQSHHLNTQTHTHKHSLLHTHTHTCTNTHTDSRTDLTDTQTYTHTHKCFTRPTVLQVKANTLKGMSFPQNRIFPGSRSTPPCSRSWKGTWGEDLWWCVGVC